MCVSFFAFRYKSAPSLIKTGAHAEVISQFRDPRDLSKEPGLGTLYVMSPTETLRARGKNRITRHVYDGKYARDRAKMIAGKVAATADKFCHFNGQRWKFATVAN